MTEKRKNCQQKVEKQFTEKGGLRADEGIWGAFWNSAIRPSVCPTVQARWLPAA